MAPSKRRRSRHSAARSHDATQRPDREERTKRAGRRRRRIVMLAGALCLLVVIVFGRTWVVTSSTQQANRLVAAHQLEPARDWLLYALSWDDGRAETHFLLARVYRKLGDSTRFRRHLADALRLGTDAERCRRERWLASAQTGQVREVQDHYGELLDDPRGDAAEICEAIANGYMLNGRFQEAVKLLDGWQASYPHDGHPYYMRGLIHRHLGDYREALIALDEALARTPNHPAAALAVADLLRQRNQFEDALKRYQQAADSPSTSLQARVGQAACLGRLGRADESRRLLTEVLASHPNNPDAVRQLAQLELSAGQSDEAVRRLRRVYALHPRDLELKYQLATALSMAGETDAASELFDQVVESRRALNLAQEKITRLGSEPESAATRVEVGRTLLEYGDRSAGLMWLNSALNVDDLFGPAHEALADYYQQEGSGNAAAQTRAQFHRRRAQKLSHSKRESASVRPAGPDAPKTDLDADPGTSDTPGAPDIKRRKRSRTGV